MLKCDCLVDQILTSHHKHGMDVKKHMLANEILETRNALILACKMFLPDIEQSPLTVDGLGKSRCSHRHLDPSFVLGPKPVPVPEQHKQTQSPQPQTSAYNTNTSVWKSLLNTNTIMDATTPSRLLALPAELRLRIYSFALAPTGSIYLHRTPTKRHAVTPSTISPALLATNRQIHAEATGVLYTENTVHIAVDAHDTAWPAINEARTPQPVLQKIEHLCILLDCTSVLWGSRYGSVDFEALTALTALRSLRLRALALPDEVEEDEDDDPAAAANAQQVPSAPVEPTWKFKDFPLLAVEILERVPVTTKILYGLDTSEDESDAAALDEPGLHEPFDKYYTPKYKTTTMPGRSHLAVAREVSAEDLQESLRSVDPEVVDLEGRRGCKAGTVKDVWGGYRNLLRSVARF
jgi:hypothetical protein